MTYPLYHTAQLGRITPTAKYTHTARPVCDGFFAVSAVEKGKVYVHIQTLRGWWRNAQWGRDYSADALAEKASVWPVGGAVAAHTYHSQPYKQRPGI
jgi:hypothetical protein